MRRFFAALLLGLLFTACNSSPKFEKTPVDQLVLSMDTVKNYTILLHDMDEEGSFSSTFKHRYKIIKNGPDGLPVEVVTEWFEVPESYFEQHINDMGMEIAHKKDGVLSKQVSPPGYGNYVGNSQYGQWRTGSDGSSFWEFYGKYAMLSNLVGMMSGPIYRSHYSDYRRSYDMGRPYYGAPSANGQPRYGTFSSYNQNSKSTFSQRMSTSSAFRNRVSDRVSRSTGTSVTSGQRSRSSSYGSGSSSSSSRKRSFGGSSRRSFGGRRR